MKLFKKLGEFLCKIGLHKDKRVTDFWMTELQQEQMPFLIDPCEVLQCSRCKRHWPKPLTFEDYKKAGGLRHSKPVFQDLGI